MAASFLREFLNSPEWEQMQNALEEAINAPILWAVSESGRSMQKSDEEYSDICQLIRETPEGLKRCRNSHRSRFREAKRTGEPIISPCFCGLVGFALPLTLEDEIIGVVGGSHRQAESPMTMEKCAELSTSCGIDLKEVMELAKKIKNMPKVEQKRLLVTLLMFTKNLSTLIRCKNEMGALFLTLDMEDQYAARLSFLSEIVKLAASELDWEEMLNSLTGKTKSVLNVDACSVYILNQYQHELMLIATDGLPKSYIGRRIEVGEGITGYVAETRKPVAVEDATADSRFSTSLSSSSSDKKRRWIYKSVLSVPLIAQDRLIGVIDVRSFKPKSWPQADTDFLAIIAEHVAGIIEKDKFRMEISRELEAAMYIQAKLLPDPLPNISGYDVAALIVPNSQVGGDYYDVIHMGKDKLGIVVADVSGKGIGAAILMANIQGLVNAYTYTQSDIELKDSISNINNVLCESTEPDKFVTMFCAILDTKANIITYTNAGHNPPFVYRAKGKPQALDVGGMVLGMIRNTDYSEGNIQLKSGDVLVLYSDGVTEARNTDGELFDVKRLHEVVEKYIAKNPDSPNAQQLLDHIYTSVRDFSDSMPLTDDLTIVVLCAN